jgi:ABC-type branched-subunit amino acid transport system substrate-binding protein
MYADAGKTAGRPRFLATLATAAAVTVILAACGGTSSNGSVGGNTLAGQTLNIGVIYPFTGDNAVQGAVGMAGCLAGIAPVNAAGGVLGAKLACKPFDTKGDPADAVPAANQMMSSASPVMVIGASDDAVATAPIVTGQHITNFATIGDPNYDHQKNQYFWRITPSDALQGIALGYYAATHKFTHTAAVFTSDLGAQTSVPPLRTEYKKLGGKFAADVTLTPGQSSYRTEVAQIIASHPDSLISEMDPQSSTTFLSEYQQQNGGQLPIVIGTERTSSNDWMEPVLGAIGAANFQKYIKAITPYVALSGTGYDHFKTSLLAEGSSQVKDPGQFTGHPYVIGDYDAVNIMALAMTTANSTSSKTYNGFITKVTDQSSGATVVHNYADGLAALKAGKTIQFVGASGALIFNKYHSAGRAFSYDDYDPATKNMTSASVIPGTALIG